MENRLFFYIFFLSSLISYVHLQSCCSDVDNKLNIIHSPIDIPVLAPGSQIKYPAYPSFVLNSTFYSLINGKKFTPVTLSSDCACDGIRYYDEFVLNDFSRSDVAYFLYMNKTVKYNLDAIYLKVYSEHSFQGRKMDLEFQLVHTLVGTPINNHPNTLIMSVLFSIAKDKKNSLIDQIISEDKDELNEADKYTFAEVKSLDFNQFFNFHKSYYYYKGNGNVHSNHQAEADWIIMEKVQSMSEKQLRMIQLAMMKEDTNIINGNARKISTSNPTTIEYVENSEIDDV